MRRRLLCVLFAAVLLASDAAAAGIAAFDSIGFHIYTGSSYQTEYDSTYAYDVYGGDPPLFMGGLTPVSIGGVWGYVDPDGKIAIDLQYKSAGVFSESRAFVGAEDGILCIDVTGQELFVLDCERAFPYSDGLAKIRKNGKYGFVDRAGNLVIEPVWDDAGYASSGYVAVFDGSAWGYVDYRGNVFVSPQYDSVGAYTDGAAYAQRGGSGVLLSLEGGEVAKNVFSPLAEGLALTRSDSGWGFVDARGELVIPCDWEDADLPSEGLIGVCRDGKWGYIDTEGELVIEPAWDAVWPFSEGMALVALSSDGETLDRYGFINSVGETIAAPRYDGARSFSNGRAAVLKGDLWGYIDPLGNEVIGRAYEYAGDFSQNLAPVGNDGLFTVIDTQGNAVTFYHDGENPTVPQPENSAEPEETEPEIQEEPDAAEKQSLSVPEIIALVLAAVILLFLVTAVTLREINIRRRKRK